MKKLLISVGLVALISGCVILPDADDHDRNPDAVGSITVSSVHFVPLESSVDGDKALKFRELRSETNLWNLVERPSLGISDLLYHRTELDVAAKVAGSVISKTSQEISQSSTSQTPTNTTITTNQTATTTPSIPSVTSPASANDSAVREKLLKLLERSTNAFHLPPDQIAGLVAAYKTYMVNLEEYLNLEGLNEERDPKGAEAGYPYKAHFTVSVTPGWYSRHHQHDAVAIIELPDGKGDPNVEMRVIAAMPSETAQAIDELAAAFRALIFSLDVEGQQNAVSGKVKLEDVLQKARRLEGLRVEKLITVSFPAGNQLAIRLRGATTANKEGRFLDSTAKTMTALVMVKSTRPQSDPLVGKEPKAKSTKGKPKTAKAPAPSAQQAPSKMQVLGVKQISFEPSAKSSNSSIETLHTLQTHLNTSGYFAPVGKYKDGEWKAPKFQDVYLGSSTKRLPIAPIQQPVSIPPWLGAARKPLVILSATGIYYADYSTVVSHQFALPKLELVLKDAEQSLKDAQVKLDALQKKKLELEKQSNELREKVEQIEADIQKAAGDAAKIDLLGKAKRETLAAKTKLDTEISKASDDAIKLETKRSEFDMAAKKAMAERDKQLDTIREAIVIAMKSGTASIRVRVDSPRVIINEDRTLSPGAVVEVLPYVNGSPLQSEDFIFPAGPAEHVLSIRPINLAGLCVVTNCSSLPEIQVNLLVKLKLDRAAQVAHASVATNVVLFPFLHSPSAPKADAAKPAAGSTSTASQNSTQNSLQITVEQAKVTLEGKPSTPPAKADK